MKLQGIFREARRDVTTGTTRTVLFTLIFAIPMAGLAAAELLQIRSITNAAEEYQKVGASISVLNSLGGIDGAACQALTQIPGVRAAGAVRAEEQRLPLSALPGAPVPVSTITAGFSELLGADMSPGPGIILSDQAAEPLGVKPGDQVETINGPVRVAGTYKYPSDGRTPGYEYMALVPSNDTKPYDECWVDVWPQSTQTAALLNTTLLPTKDVDQGKATIGQLNSTLGTKFAGESLFNDRLTRVAPLVAGIVALALGYLALRLRRLEIASNLHAGVARSNLFTIMALETFSWILPAIIFAETAIVLLIASDPSSDRSSLMMVANRSIFTAVVGAMLGASIAWIFTREKQLFAYFKAR